MEVLTENSLFSAGEGEPMLATMLLRVNFRRLRNNLQEDNLSVSPGDLLHSVAGLYSVALPDIELEAVYNSLTNGSHTLALVTSPDAILDYRKKHPDVSTAKKDKQRHTEEEKDKEKKEEEEEEEEKEEEEEEDEEATFSDIFSASDCDDDESCTDEYSEERDQFLAAARSRKALDQQDPASVGVADRLVACITYLRLTCQPGESSVQIILLAVRRRYRRMGIGRYLMQQCKDPTVVGQYDKLLAYADHKAESFFTLHGFSDDPILTVVLRKKADHWENSTLMVYIPPFSIPSTGVGTIRSLTSLDEHITRCKTLAIQTHAEQIGLVERMKHELLLLQAKVQSQDDVIAAMRRELRQCNLEKSLVELEFAQYRQHMAATVAGLATRGARQWLTAVEERRTDTQQTSSEEENTAHDS